MERQKVIESVKELKQKKALIDYRMARERWQEMNKKKKGAIEILGEANKHLEPVQMFIRDGEKQVCLQLYLIIIVAALSRILY